MKSSPPSYPRTIEQRLTVVEQAVLSLTALVPVILQMRDDLAELKADVAVLKADVAILKADVEILKADVAELKSNVAILQSDVVLLKSDVADLKGDVSSLKSNCAQHTTQLRVLEQLLEADRQHTDSQFKLVFQRFDTYYV